MSTLSPSVAATRAWLQTVIIGLGLCPFAKRELDADRIRIVDDTESAVEACLQSLIAECAYLDNEDTVATTLLVYPKAFVTFDEYLDYLGIAEDLLIAQGYEGVYQLASFHPLYQFDETMPEDAANYTNRSPFPMLHILRESSIEAAVDSHPDAEGIPPRNIKLTRKLGLNHLQALLAACYS